MIKRIQKKTFLVQKKEKYSSLCGYNRDVLLYVYTAYHIKIFDDMYINYFLVSQVDRSIDRSVVGGSIGVAILFVFFRGRVGIVVGGIVVFFFLARVRFAQTHSRRFGFLFLLFFVPAAIFS